MKKIILLFACLIGISAMAQDIDAVKFVQGSTTDWYMLSSMPSVMVDGTSITIDGKLYDLAQGEVTTTFGTAPEDTWFTLRTNVTPNDWGTICMERNITAIDGATFWNVVAERTSDIELEQVFDPQAGYGYLIRFTANELKVKYGNERVLNPVKASTDHPIQGTFVALNPDGEGNNPALEGNYIVYQNQLRKAGKWVALGDHRAYVVANIAPSTAPAVAKGPRMTLAKPSEAPTLLGDKIQATKCRKVLNDGLLLIIKDNKTYNAQGSLVN